MAEIVRVILGTALMAVSVTSCFDAMGIVTGGFSGIAILIHHITAGFVPIWVTNLILNIPLFLFAFRKLNRKRSAYLLLGNLLLTLFLSLLPILRILTGDTIIDITIGAVLMGAGLGLIFSADASSGGTDLLAILIHNRLKYISVSKILAALDGMIVAAGGAVFGLVNVIYALIAIFIVTKTADYVMEGPGRAKLIYIISDKNEETADYIMKEIERGVSSIRICGMYTKQERSMLICVVSAKEIVKIKDFLYNIDRNAICFIGEIKEAFGEGFTNYTV